MGHASLKLAPMIGFEEKPLLQVFDLRTNPDHWNKGEATRLMQELCRRADLSAFMLALEPQRHSHRPMGAPLDNTQLERWYGKFGFERIQDKPVLMCREPKRKVWNIDTDEVVEVGGH